MNEHDRTAKGAAPGDDEVEVRRLLERAGPRPPIPAEDLEAVTAAARADWRREVARRPAPIAPVRPQRPAWALPALMAALVLICAGLVWWLARGSGAAAEFAHAESVIGTTWIENEATGGPRPLRAGDAIRAGAVLTTADGTGEAVAGRASLRLHDGTVLRLDAGTIVRLASPAAVALDQGALYADSGKNGSGLTVTTPAGTASDVGTRFTVRLLDLARPTLEVRVRDGAVAVEHAGRSWLTPAGEELSIDPDGETHRRPIDPWGPDWEWVLEAAAGYRIEGRTLGELLDWATRETGWTLRWADPALAASARDVVLRGDIGRLRPDQAPFAVLPGAGLEGELVEGEAGGELVIRPRQNS